MGNTNDPTHPLPQIWQRINPQNLRHRFTHEVIQQHSLLLHSQQHQLEALHRLKHRIALHHTSIVKVIYFKQSEQPSLCSPTPTYPLFIYTQYAGDTLEQVAEEKGERVYHLPCQCTSILTASDYLRDHYGFFIVTPSHVFLGNRKEKSTKVWIHSRVELTEREFPCTEEEMCDSLCKVIRYMKSNRICVSTTSEHLTAMQRISSLSTLKQLIFDIHRNKQQHSKHKKSNSVVLAPPRQEEQNAEHRDVEESRKVHSGKANSMPSKDEERPQAKQTQYPKYTTPQFYRPIHSNNPVKINFIYPKQQNKNKSLPQPPCRDTLPPPQVPYSHIPPQQSSRQERSIKGKGEGNPSLFSPLIPMSDSVSHSPQVRIQQPVGNFTGREMELPLHEVSEKITPARLPTTSRSPKLPKEPLDMKQTEQPPPIANSRYKRKVSQQETVTNKAKEKPSSINSSGKFEKYKDAIKNYEEKLRLKLASSMGGVNSLSSNNGKGKVGVRKAVSSPPQKGGEFKQTKSLYNDSQDDLPKDQFQGEGREKERMQLQRELQKEKVIIQNELQDVLNQNAMREEYRNIREKIKHKKETFAQLKAEATKILEDLEF